MPLFCYGVSISRVLTCIQTPTPPHHGRTARPSHSVVFNRATLSPPPPPHTTRLNRSLPSRSRVFNTHSRRGHRRRRSEVTAGVTRLQCWASAFL